MRLEGQLDRLVEVVEDFHHRGIISAEERHRLLRTCFDRGSEPEVVLDLIEDLSDWLQSRGQPSAAEGIRLVRAELEPVVEEAAKQPPPAS